MDKTARGLQLWYDFSEYFLVVYFNISPATISCDVYRKASSTVHRPGDDCCWKCNRCACGRFCRECRVAATHLESIRSQHVTPKCWMLSVCVQLQLLWKGGRVLTFGNNPNESKFYLGKKLRAERSQGELAIIRCSIFCLPICNPKISRLSYTEL